MIYLVDASALITAHNTYLAIPRVPEYWDWLIHHGQAGNIKIPKLIYKEVTDGHDDLADWMKEDATKAALQLKEEPDPAHVQAALACYGKGLSEADLVIIGKDPFLVAAAMSDPVGRCVVTSEVSKPTRTGARRHVPNVCSDCSIVCKTPIQLLNELNFSTKWDG
ncbi:DUF4411 family protein [Sphingomicrobium clamense]|uniref:DUF4411 family protein n=1 Tax=Sphingomicrobium clamense TaxID=2851013 RepID=A0ABS6V887_9SPHN|nr:DUF4411 family protein [Sphingomicrobium sp. B8]MBW0145771.1 DUF4411 family protein [Sphingomicrobium sp. B8]